MMMANTSTLTLSSTHIFEFWWQQSGNWVEPANQRRGGNSGVQLLTAIEQGQKPLYCKRQTGHIYRTLMYPLGRPTILRERLAYRAFSRLDVNVPRLIYCSARRQHGNWQALLVTEALDGFINLEQWYAQQHSQDVVKAVLKQLAIDLAQLHRHRWQHGCCYAKHIFVKTKTDNNGTIAVDIAFLDLEKSRRRWRIRDAAYHDLKQLNRHAGGLSKDDLALLFLFHQQALYPEPNSPH